MFPLAVVTPLIEQLRSLVLGLMRPLGDRVRKAPPCRPEHKLIPEPLVVLIQAWLQKQRQMIEALIRRIAAGAHHPRPYKPREIKPGAIPTLRPEIPPEKRLPPKVFGWINHMASEISPWAAAMNHFIGVPEMKAMVLASPQLARLWVPLLNAVGAEKPDWWPKPPPRPRKPRPARPRNRKAVMSGLDPTIASAPATPPARPAAAGLASTETAAAREPPAIQTLPPRWWAPPDATPVPPVQNLAPQPAPLTYQERLLHIMRQLPSSI